jgi:hypothetical protein
MQLFIIIIILTLSLASALIGISTNYWYESLSYDVNEGLWVICRRPSSLPDSNKICRKQPYNNSQGLTVAGVVLLFIAIILSIIRLYRKKNRFLAYTTILILTGSTLLLIFGYLSHPKQINLRQLGYSIYFMLMGSILTLITIGLVAFSARSTDDST